MVKKSKKVMICMLMFFTVLFGYIDSIAPSVVRADSSTFRDNFDGEPLGTKSSGNGWTIGNTPTFGTATIVPDPSAVNKSLKLTDNDYDPNNVYRGVSATRTFTPQTTGKFTLETKIRIDKFDNSYSQQHFNVVFQDNASSPNTALKLVYSGGSWKYISSTGVPTPLPTADFLGKWVTIRVAFDIPNGKYNIKLISDAYKTSRSTDPNIDKATGTASLTGLTFNSVANVSKVLYLPQDYKGAYYIDYLAMDNAPPTWSPNGTLTASEKTPTSVKLTWSGTASDDSLVIDKYNIYDVTTPQTPILVGTAAGGNTTSTTINNITLGNHNYKVEAEDALGNISTTGATVTGVSFIQDSFKENFDNEPPGTKSNGGGWTIGNTPTYGTATIVTDNAPN